ncbi:MAG: FAD:protein FMN transferase [Clostridia bacterium]|nr:FAD:protein FMN transferase [Clostridia bacterium]
MKSLSKKSVIIIIVAVIVAAAIVAVSVIDAVYQSRNKAVTHTTIAMGSVVSQTIYGGSQDVCLSVSQAVAELDEERLSATSLVSEITQINKNAGIAPVTVSDETLSYIIAGIEISDKTNGAFNICMGALIDLWDIGGQNPRVPTQQEIDVALSLCDYTQIHIDGNNVFLAQSGMKIHFGAIGKGAGCDIAVDTIKQNEDVAGAVVSVGGSVATYGENPKSDVWTVGIRDPKGGVNDRLGLLKINGEAYISTSGSYEKYFEQDGRKYHHILDYSTGTPAQTELLGVTVIAPSGFLSDALSTACFVLDVQTALGVLEYYDCQAIFVFENGDVTLTNGVAENFGLESESYRIAQVYGG